MGPNTRYTKRRDESLTPPKPGDPWPSYTPVPGPVWPLSSPMAHVTHPTSSHDLSTLASYPRCLLLRFRLRVAPRECRLYCRPGSGWQEVYALQLTNEQSQEVQTFVTARSCIPPFQTCCLFEANCAHSFCEGAEGRAGQRGERTEGRTRRGTNAQRGERAEGRTRRGANALILERPTVKTSCLITLQALLHLCKATLRVEVLVIKHKASHAEDMLITTAAL